MDKFVIKGPSKVKGVVSCSGSKNLALPLLAATLLFDKPVILKTIYINKNDRLPKEIFFIPPILVFILIYLNQHRRRNKKNRAQNEKK